MNWTMTILSFLLGSVPFGLLFARARGVDIRSVGSGNIGATNVGRTLGKRAGILTLACDVLKGALPVWIAQVLGFSAGWVATICLATVLGHIYSPWLGFRGGKGVATAGGAFVVAAPVPGVIGLLAFALAAKWSRRVSVGSMVGMVVLFGALWATGAPAQLTAAGGIAAFVIIVRHKENLQRLQAGTEPKFGSS